MNKNILKVLFTLLITFAATFSILARNDDVGAVTFVIGKADVVRDGKKMPAKPGLKLQNTDILETASKSTMLVELRGGSRLKLKNETRMVLSSVTGKEDAKLKLEKGSVFASVIKRNGTEGFTIISPTATAGVRGTEFFFAYGKKDDLWLCVNEGTVAVTGVAEKQEKLVLAGQGVFIEGKGKVSDPAALAWTKQLNWNMDPQSGQLEDKTDINSAYEDLRKHNYD